MKKLFLLSLLLLISACSSNSNRSGEVKVLAYNIRHGADTSWKMRLADQAAFLKSRQADLIALQEVDESCTRSGKVDQPKMFGKELQMTPVFQHFLDNFQGGRYGIGAATIDFMRESVTKKKPFCMSVFYKAPHRPVTPDPMFNDIYKHTIFRKLPNYGREKGKHLALHSQKGRQYPRFIEWGTPHRYPNFRILLR